MWNYPIEENLLYKFGKYAKVAGIIFILLGIVGIVYPVFMTMATVAFISWLMLLAGVSAGYFTWLSNRNDWLGWLKAVILVGVALFILFYPLSGAATVGLLLSIYFFMDAFAGFGLASTMHPSKGWWIWLLNALLSLGLGFIFIAGWPFSSLYLVGLFVGISLFFDGIALFFTGSLFQKINR
jgi:uncharacterized membrane protein HdeD (DUF308 family)